MHSSSIRSLTGLVLSGLAIAAPATRIASAQLSSTASSFAPLLLLFNALKYRQVGPNRGGRSTTVTGVPSQPLTFYMGVASGGVWKTVDAGQTWTPITDGKVPVGSTGSIAVAESNPNVVYLGTGSDDIRSNVSTGRGVYRSDDAGSSWRFIGLRDAGQVGAVRIDPANPEVAYVAAIGNAFAPNAERGVFRTRDGGKTWQNVLFVSDSVGAADIEIQPGAPNVLYAWMWRGVRHPWTIVSGGPSSIGQGFYKSTDGGDHWTKITAGLPNDLIGKANIAVTAANPQRVYLLMEAKPGGGLYRSDDAGEHFTLATSYAQLITRPFYYVTLAADPTNADVVYAGAEGFFKSIDGGKTFRSFPVPHGDNHDMWISPRDGNVMIQANDGGANVSLNGGRTWSTQYNQPTAEIYGIGLDERFPYLIYGAQQDNTTVIVPSLPLGTGQGEEWRVGPGCETGPIMPDRLSPDTVYGACKGQFGVMNLKVGQEKNYWVGAQSLYGNVGADLIYRFQRVSPMEVSPHEPHTVYYGSQYVHRTRDQGVSWERISPDLTANDPRYRNAISGEPITRDMTGEEVYSTLYAIRESPSEAGLIWTGANDGPFYITRDNGKTWRNITPAGLAPGGRVQNIEPSPHRKGSAYYAVYRYLLGDFRPYIYRTNDYGAHWTLLTSGMNGIPADDPTRVVREDPAREGLLYAGTEFGMYISFDDGAHWQPFQLNLPVTPITDIRVHGSDLVVSTQGRSFWILDDLTPLRQASASLASGKPMLFRPRDAVRTRYQAGGGFGRGAGPAAPQYPPVGAFLDYWLPNDSAGTVTIDILDRAGKVVRTLSSTAPAAPARVAGGEAASEDPDAGPRRRGATVRLAKGAGLNRVIWDLSYPGTWDASTQAPGGGGPMVVPGTYTVRLTVDGVSQSQPLAVREDPRVLADGVTIADLRAQLEHNLRVRDAVSEANRAVYRVHRAIDRLANATGPGADTLQKLRAIEARLVTPAIRYSKPELQAHLQYLYGMTNAADQRIGRDAVERYKSLKRELDIIDGELARLLGPEPSTLSRR